MTCDQSELRMAELLVGEISPGDRAGLERHLLDCEACRDDYELARAGVRVEWADVPVPAAIIESTLASLQEPPPLVRFFRWGTAAAVLVSVAVLLMSSSPRTVLPTTPTEAAATGASPRTEVLATMQEPIVGALVCRDDAGRPVGELGLRSHEVSVEILDGIAKTTVEENFENHTDRRLEGTFTFPLPADASISRLALEVNGKIEEGTCLERERARQVFESIVRKMQDPALLEWQPGGLFKCRVFPIEPRATKRVIVAYTQTLPCFQGKMRYVYPLASEKTRTHPPGELSINVTAKFSGALASMTSTSHQLDVQRKNEREASLAFRAANYRPNNDFVVMLEPREEEVRVVSHKPDDEPGYFACFATPQAAEAREPRKYTFVLDASASINAPRLEVAKRLVRAMMERRIEGDRFEILAHSIEVASSGEVDLRAANTFLDGLRPMGASDVLKALHSAPPGELIYIGKGLPTFGETETATILEAVKGRRIRTIAVGSDANLPLLERLGGLMRITPNDDVDKRVGEIAATLGSSVIAELKVEGENISEVCGARDVFAGERLVAVGRYKAAGTSKVVLSGRGYRREIDVTFPPKEESNNPVRRLWAQRKASDLIALGDSKKAEITDLGVKYQIMTPYTSFLVLENEQMWKDHQLKREVQKQDQVLARKTPAPDEARDGFKVRIEQAQVEITKHVRDGERYLNARMYDQARKSFEDAEFKILNLPDPVKPMNDLLPLVKDSIVKSRNAQILEGLRTEEEKLRYAEAEATAHPLKSPPQTGAEWEELIGKLKANHAVTETQKTAQADARYQRAERLYAEGQVEQAEEETKAALEIAPNHAAARALFAESQFILGKGKATPATKEYDSFMQAALVRHQQVLVEMDNALEKGSRFRSLGDNDQADREFRKVLEYSKWMPAGPEVETRRKQAYAIVTNVTAPGAPVTDALPMVVGESGKAASISDLQRLNTKYEADMLVMTRQLEVQLAQIQELTTKVDEHRSKLAKSLNEKSLAVAEVQYARQQAERLEGELRDLEEGRRTLSQGLVQFEGKLSSIVVSGANINVAPRKSLEAKVTAIALEIGMVVISIGKDDGVLEGDEFTIFRGGTFIARVVIDRVDRKWASGKIVRKDQDPRVADDATNLIYVGEKKPVVSEARDLDLESREALKAIRAKMGLKE